MSTRNFRQMVGVLAALALLGSAGCGDVVRQGTGSSYAILQGLEARSGADKSAVFSTYLDSDVVTLVEDTSAGSTIYIPTVFDDPGRARFIIAAKDVTNPAAPTSNNAVTFTRYHVVFARSDGRNTPGVDVPYAFDGAATFTVEPGKEVEVGFNLVRIQAKLEAPLIQLRNGGGAKTISTIAQVTFYGTDQTGHELTVTGSIGVNFADWGDPK